MRLSATDRNQVLRKIQNLWAKTHANNTYLTFLEWSGVSQEALLEDIKNKLQVDRETLKRALVLVGQGDKEITEQVRTVFLYISDYEIRQMLSSTPCSDIINQSIGTIKLLSPNYYANIDIEHLYPNKIKEYYTYLKNTLVENRSTSDDLDQIVNDIDLCITLASSIDDLCKTMPFLGDIVKRVKDFGEDTNKSE